MKLNGIEGNIGLVNRVTEIVSNVTNLVQVGSFDAPKEGVIRRIRASGDTNLTSFTLALAESDCFTSGDFDSIDIIAAYKVNEPRIDIKGDSTLYVLDESAGDLYYNLTAQATSKSRNYGEMFYAVYTDNPGNTTIAIKLDIEPIA